MQIDISGSAQMKVDFMSKKAESLDEPMGEAVTFMERQTRMRFLKEQDPDGNKWAALSPATVRQKATRSILRETANLINSISSEHSGNRGRVYTNVEYAIWHQTGTSKMPARRILGFNQAEDIPKIEKIFRQHFGL